MNEMTTPYAKQCTECRLAKTDLDDHQECHGCGKYLCWECYVALNTHPHCDDRMCDKCLEQVELDYEQDEYERNLYYRR